jgi:Cys-rich repeat protein
MGTDAKVASRGRRSVCTADPRECFQNTGSNFRPVVLQRSNMKMTWKRRTLVLAVTLVNALSLVGCTDDEGGSATGVTGDEETCSSDTDCQNSLRCAQGSCRVQCNSSSDCPTGQRCVSADRGIHVCAVPQERGCTVNSDCPEGSVCSVDLLCRTQCDSSAECALGQVCSGGLCKPREDG